MTTLHTHKSKMYRFQTFIIVLIETVALAMLVSSFRLLRQCPGHIDTRTFTVVLGLPIITFLWFIFIFASIPAKFDIRSWVHALLRVWVAGVFAYSIAVGFEFDAICKMDYCACTTFWTHIDYIISIALQSIIVVYNIFRVFSLYGYKAVPVKEEATSSKTVAEYCNLCTVLFIVGGVLIAGVILTVVSYSYATCGSMFANDILVYNKVHDPDSNSQVLVWSASPFGFAGGDYNQTRLDEYLDDWASIKQQKLVDTISVVAMTLWPNRTLGLHPNIVPVVNGLHGLGFDVTALIGSAWIQHSGPFMRSVLRNSTFLDELQTNTNLLPNVTGLNFDFEPNPETLNPADACMYVDIMNKTKGLFPHLEITVDTATNDPMIDTAHLYKCPGADSISYYYSMNTYGDTLCTLRDGIKRQYETTSHLHFAIGLCVECIKDTDALVELKLKVLRRMCVKRLAFWAEHRFLQRPRIAAALHEWRNHVDTRC